MNVSRQRIFDFSGGPQEATSWLLKAPNELKDSRNMLFGEEIGSAVRRLGYVTQGDAFATGGNRIPLGAHTANFTTGPIRMVAVNNDAGTQTLVRSQNPATGAWTTIISDFPPNAQVFFVDYIDHVFVSGYVPSSGAYLEPRTIDNTLTVSSTLHLLNGPRCKFFVEYLGLMYAVNSEVASVAYPDRAYRSSAPIGAISYMQGAQTGILTKFLVDSVRYLKVGMNLDIYDAGTETKLYDLAITAVDKDAGTFSIVDHSATFTANTTTEFLTLTDAVNYVNTNTIQFTTTNTLPAPLAINTRYFVVGKTGNTFQVATTSGGSAINLTTTGTGTHTVGKHLAVSDNDEIWLDGRKGTRTIFWNTDFPTPEEAQFLAISPGKDSSHELTGAISSANRLYLFTANSGTRYDRSNLITFSNSIGCVSQRSLLNMDDDWLMWVDSSGRVQARKEGAQPQDVSRAIRKIFRKVNMDGLKASSAVKVDNRYKLYIGSVSGELMRVVYEFDTNTWELESHGTKKPMMQILDSYSGFVRSYFASDDGILYLDEEGNLDAGQAIPWHIETGRDNQGREQDKRYTGFKVFTDDATASKVLGAVDDSEWRTIGEIESIVQYLRVAKTNDVAANLPEGTSINIKISGSSPGNRPVIQAIVPYFSVIEETPSGRQRSV